MSKCGINRYKAGGRCGTFGAFETSAKGVDTSQVGTNFAAILAQREAQDAIMRAPPGKQYATPALTQVAASQALVPSSAIVKHSPTDSGHQRDDSTIGTSHHVAVAKHWHPAVKGNVSDKQKDIDMILRGDFD